MQETWVRSLGWEDPLEKGKATHSSVLAWRIPWTIQSMGLRRGRHDWVTFTFTVSYLENTGTAELHSRQYAFSFFSWSHSHSFFKKLIIFPMASARNDFSLAQVTPAVKASQELPRWLPSWAHQGPPQTCLGFHVPPSLLLLCRRIHPLFSPLVLFRHNGHSLAHRHTAATGLCTLCFIFCYLSWFTLSQFPQDGTQMSPYLSSRPFLIPNLNHHRHHHQDISHKNRGFQLL